MTTGVIGYLRCRRSSARWGFKLFRTLVHVGMWNQTPNTGNELTFKSRSTHTVCEMFLSCYPANTCGVRGGGRLSLSTLLASIAETVRGRISNGYFSRMSFTSCCTPAGQERRSACKLWAASISISWRLLRPDKSSRLWLSWARTGLVAVTPGAGPVWGQSASELLSRGEAWPDM